MLDAILNNRICHAILLNHIQCNISCSKFTIIIFISASVIAIFNLGKAENYYPKYVLSCILLLALPLFYNVYYLCNLLTIYNIVTRVLLTYQFKWYEISKLPTTLLQLFIYILYVFLLCIHNIIDCVNVKLC